jgi:UDP-N-acetylglucosamine--N-acetylmuramyl-(pentapeptide) pyrophosphoryl-undecaprenol N-acetylglucosamine transferase
MEADLVKRAGVPFEAIPAAGLHGVGVRALPGNLAQLARGLRAAGRLLRQFQPDVLFFTGGFVAAPVAVAARLTPAARRPRSVVYTPDIEPGLALQSLSWFADRIAVTTEVSRAYYRRPQRVVVTGYPTRPDLGQWQRPQARKALGLTDDLPVLLVFGGSKGARSINRALIASLPELLPEMQIVHLSGQLDWDEARQAKDALSQRLGEDMASRYHAYLYLHEAMGAALAAADLALSRAGASSLGEFPLFSLPAILVPYPYAWRYQKVNAMHLVSRGAAELLPDEQLSAGLVERVKALLGEPQKLREMSAAMRRLACPDAAEKIAAQILSLGGAA